MTEFGRVNHEKHTGLSTFAAYIASHMKLLPESRWPAVFKQLSDNTTYDITELKREVWRYINA